MAGLDFITKEDIDTVCHRTPENNKYALSNAIMNTNTSNALKILNELIDSRMEYTEIFGVISSCILDLYKVKIGFAAGLNAKEIQVYTNEKVPCGDGGIALGQMYLATFE